MIDRYLNDLENRLDPVQEEALYRAWTGFADGQAGTGPFCPKRRTPLPPGLDWPDIPLNDALADEEKMLLSQFKLCSDQLAASSDLLLSVRANYGVGIIPSFFGAEPFIMPATMNCLPNVRPLPGGSQAIGHLVGAPLPDLNQGYGPQVFRMAALYRQVRARYPRIARYIRVDHPDCQGPFDIVELLWGSDVFLALFDEPERVHALLDYLCRFYSYFMDAWFAAMPPTDDYHAYFGRLHRGLITIRDDSAMNLSPDLCRTFVHPYDARLLDRYGGAIHFCGRGDHYLTDMVRSKGLSAIDMSQPHLNDMKQILRVTIDQGINLHTVHDPSIDALLGSNHAWPRLSLR